MRCANGLRPDDEQKPRQSSDPDAEMMLPWGNFLRPKDSLGLESRTLFFVAVSWLVMTLRFVAGGLVFEFGPIHWDIAPALVTDYGVAVAAVIAVWVGREFQCGLGRGLDMLAGCQSSLFALALHAFDVFIGLELPDTKQQRQRGANNGDNRFKHRACSVPILGKRTARRGID